MHQISFSMAKQEQSTTIKKPRKNQLDKERELARFYYFQGDSQKAIAERIGVSAQSVNKWVKEGRWEEIRAAKTISRKEIVIKMLQKINERLDADDWTADEIIKAAKAVEKLDKDTNVVTIMEVFTSFGNWLAARMQIDPELTPETVQVITKYQEIFVGEMMSAYKPNH